MGLVELLAPGIDQLLDQVAGDLLVRADARTWCLSPTWTPGRVALHGDDQDVWIVVEHVAATGVSCTAEVSQALAATTGAARSSATLVDDIAVHRRVVPVRHLDPTSLCDALRDTASAADQLRVELVDRLGLGGAPYSDPRFADWGQRDGEQRPAELPETNGGYL